MRREPVLLDTSVAVPLVVTGHEAHEATLEACDGLELGLAGHAWFETFSVLTRLPAPARRDARQVVAVLDHNFPRTTFLSADEAADLAARLPALGVVGGAVYDALVGQAASTVGLRLLSRDRRAAASYRAVGAAVEYMD